MRSACDEVNATSLAEDASACRSTLDELMSALMTRRRYSSHPVLASDARQLLSITSRWLDDCPHVTVTVRRTEHLRSILGVADLVFGHRAGELSESASFFRSCRFTCFLSHRSTLY